MRLNARGLGRGSHNDFPRIKAAMNAKVSAVVKSAAGQVALIAAAKMEGQEGPSAPGHAPAIDTGLLHGSIDSVQTGPAEAMAYTNVEYGQHLEFGTVFMEERPFLRPSADEVDPSFQKAIRAALRGRLG